jgi:hypothetical protein
LAEIPSGSGCGVPSRQADCVCSGVAGVAHALARGAERRHQHQIDPGTVDEQNALEGAFFLETTGRICRDRPRIVPEHDKTHALKIEVFPAIVERQRQRFFAKTLAPVLFVADPDAEIR